MFLDKLPFFVCKYLHFRKFEMFFFCLPKVKILHALMSRNSLPNDYIFRPVQMKVYAEDKIYVTEKVKFVKKG